MVHKPISIMILPLFLALTGVLILAVLTAIPSNNNHAFAEESNTTGFGPESNTTGFGQEQQQPTNTTGFGQAGAARLLTLLDLDRSSRLLTLLDLDSNSRY